MIESEFLTKPEILVAGCGTGQHSISVAGRFENSHLTVIDLNKMSLAYAIRKTRDCRPRGIDYFRADILSLEDWDPRFGLLKRAGVLHHMREPGTGWKILSSLL